MRAVKGSIKRAGVRSNEVQMVSLSGDEVVVRLQPPALDLAVALHQEFGDLVRISVGFKSYPDLKLLTPVDIALFEMGEAVPSLNAKCRIDDSYVSAGETTYGQVVLKNDRQDVLEFDCFTGTGWLCRPNSLTVVGGFSGFIGSRGQAIRLEPAMEQPLNFILGTSSCEDSVDSYGVSPGVYAVVVPVTIATEVFKGDRRYYKLIADECVITIN